MKIGDMEISRDQMPSFSMLQLDPSHIDSAFQDVLNRNLPPIYQGAAQPMQVGEQPQ